MKLEKERTEKCTSVVNRRGHELSAIRPKFEVWGVEAFYLQLRFRCAERTGEFAHRGVLPFGAQLYLFCKPPKTRGNCFELVSAVAETTMECARCAGCLCSVLLTAIVVECGTKCKSVHGRGSALCSVLVFVFVRSCSCLPELA